MPLVAWSVLIYAGALIASLTVAAPARVILGVIALATTVAFAARARQPARS